MFLKRFAPSCCAAALLFASAGEVEAAELLPGPYEAAVERVVDGDTLAVRVTVWLGQELSVLVRVRGVDAPELRSRCADERMRAVNAAAALSQVVGERPVMLRRVEGDKYFGRVVADVSTSAGRDLGDALLAGGFARAYAGGARRPWCEKSADQANLGAIPTE
jgi:endonuclease YncB( thermonuclease family)